MHFHAAALNLVMKRRVVISLAAAGTLICALSLAWPRMDFWMLTGHVAPVQEIESLQHPAVVAGWNSSALLLADGRTVQLAGISDLPEESMALREALKRGVDVRQDGRVWALVRIHHWCGNDPVREHVARVDLGEMIVFLRLGKPATTAANIEHLAREPGGSFSEWGWNISEFGQFESWQTLKRLTAARKNASPIEHGKVK